MSGITCPKCENKMGSLANFCNQCGTKLPPPNEPIDLDEKEGAKENFAEGKYFGMCGTASHGFQRKLADAKFCIICGRKI
ncbi:zinc ribbon domain-containing protein [Patescibacteria group bacterium]|nr:zinc ribbon domain-containing protein [Patescibacteria group bacterium]